MQIKKAYEALHTILEASLKNKKLDQATYDKALKLMVARKAGDDNYILDANGKPQAVICYYFKRWMPLVGTKAVEFGIKANSKTGLNTMCKEGASNWNKQLVAHRKGKDEVIKKVSAGEIKPENIQTELDKLDKVRSQIVKTDLGFNTKEEVEAYLNSPQAKQ